MTYGGNFQKLDEGFKSRWLAALRSGEYAQARSMLRNISDGFCCLGVACDLKDPFLWKQDVITWRWGEVQGGDYPPFLDSAASRILMEMNDRVCKSFDEIADWIEEYL